MTRPIDALKRCRYCDRLSPTNPCAECDQTPGPQRGPARWDGCRWRICGFRSPPHEILESQIAIRLPEEK